MRRLALTHLIGIWLAAVTGPAAPAEPAPFLSKREPLFSMNRKSAAVAPRASLFADRAEYGLFAPWPEAKIEPLPSPFTPTARRIAAQMRDLIALAEAGPDGYDAVQYGAWIRPPSRPTSLTLGQIDRWIRDTPGQPHAIGRYQFIPQTLRWLVARLDLPPDTRFTPRVQDELANLLLADAGLEAVLSGDLHRQTFMRNLARIWAGFPLPDGQSYYEGVAGNTATMSWRAFETKIAQIMP